MAEVPSGDDQVYVALGKEVEESKLTLLWALQNLRMKKVNLLHVHQPSDMTPSTSGLGAEDNDVVHEAEWKSMYERLHEYIGICQQEGVNAENIDVSCTARREVGEGIVELIYENCVKKLVMGAAADKYFSESMVYLKSRKAKYVSQYAPHSCKLWFICRGHLIYTGEGQFDLADIEDSSSEFGDSASSSSQAGLSSLLVPYEETRGVEDELQSFASLDDEEHSEQRGNDQIYIQLEQAMKDAEKSKTEAFEESIRRFKAEKDAIEANRRAREFETKYNEELRLRKEFEEALAKEKGEHETTKQERHEALSNAQDNQSLYNEELRRRKEIEDILEKEKEEMEKMKKEMEEVNQTAEDRRQLVEIYEKELEKLLVERDDANKMTQALLISLAEEPSLQSSLSSQQSSDQLPSYFICPISHEIMRDPHVAADGHTYEAEEFKNWLNTGGLTSPMTNLMLAHLDTIPNHALRSAIQEWMQQHPTYLDSS